MKLCKETKLEGNIQIRGKCCNFNEILNNNWNMWLSWGKLDTNMQDSIVKLLWLLYYTPLSYSLSSFISFWWSGYWNPSLPTLKISHIDWEYGLQRHMKIVVQYKKLTNITSEVHKFGLDSILMIHKMNSLNYF